MFGRIRDWLAVDFYEEMHDSRKGGYGHMWDDGEHLSGVFHYDMKGDCNALLAKGWLVGYMSMKDLDVSCLMLCMIDAFGWRFFFSLGCL